MNNADQNPTFTPSPDEVCEVINTEGEGAYVLLCEHASAHIPAELNDLGLKAADRYSHAAWDIGASEVARALSIALDAPLVAAKLSRLIYDCNRPPSAKDCIPTRSERIEIPGNEGLSQSERGSRITHIHDVFHAQANDVITNKLACHPNCQIITIHSFTPNYNGIKRETHFGFLHDADTRFAIECAVQAKNIALPQVYLNQPYSADDGVTYSLAQHGTKNNLHNVMIEIRNDLINDPANIQAVANQLAQTIRSATKTLSATHEERA